MAYILTARSWNTPYYSIKSKRERLSSIVAFAFLCFSYAFFILGSSQAGASEPPSLEEVKGDSNAKPKESGTKKTRSEKPKSAKTESEKSDSDGSNQEESKNTTSDQDNASETQPPSKILEKSKSDSSNSNTSESNLSGSKDKNSAVLPGLEQNRITRQQHQNPWLFLHEYKATYDVISDNDKLGTATRNLFSTEKGWKLQMTTRIKKWMLSLKSNEFSEFDIAENELKTRRFYTSSKVTFKSARIIEQLFDWDNKIEKGTRDKRTWELPIEDTIFDRMSHIIQMRADLLSGKEKLEYLVSYKGIRKPFNYQLMTEELLDTPIGKVQTIKIDRVKGDESRYSVWLSPEHNYLPVKIAQIEQDKPDVVLLVKSFEYLESNPPTIAKIESQEDLQN